MARLFCFGLGYAARALARLVETEGWSVAGTSRSGGDGTIPFSREAPLPPGVLDGATHVLVTVPPDGNGDPVCDLAGEAVAAIPGLRWVGYHSTTGVYGDTRGQPVDETAPLRPTGERGRRRVAAEDAWRALSERRGMPLHVFRLPGIYGPGRSALDKVRDGTAKRIDKPGHRFSRIHVDDIARVLYASMAGPEPGAIYNVADDRPAPPTEVTEFACGLLGVAPPPLVPFEDAKRAMSPMALSFWRDDRLVDNGRMKALLKGGLKHPDFEAGLRATLAAEETGKGS